MSVADTLEACLRLQTSIDSGVLFSNSSAILSFSTLDPYQSRSREFLKYFSCDFPCSPSKLSSFSPSRKFRICMNEVESEAFWEIWNNARLIQCKSMKTAHSTCVNHPCFGKVSWSGSEKYVIYIANATVKKSGSFWSDCEIKGNFFTDSLGEELLNVVNPEMFVYEIATNTIRNLVVSNDIYPAQPCFHPLSDEFVYIGYEKTPYKIGIRAILNRSTKLYKSSIEGNTEEIPMHQDYMAALYPKYSPDGKKISYFAVPKDSLSHSMCLSLVVHNLETQENSVVLNTVEEFNENFNGIYGFQDKLMQYGWANCGHIAFVTHHNCSEVIFITDLQGQLVPITPSLQVPYSTNILDIYESSILFKSSNVKTPDQASIFTLPSSTILLLSNSFQSAISPQEALIQQALDSCEQHLLPHKTSPNKSILYKNPNSKYLLVSIHGGPHASSYIEYTAITSLRLSLGFSFLEVNYRGSTGFGEKSRKQLLGNIGNFDVEDCIEAIEMAKEIISFKKIVIHGKSMGGFLSAHLASRINPDLCVILAAVSNVASMALSTDMNEWPFALANNSNPAYPPDVSQIMQMYEKSPICYFDRVKCPVLLATGGVDVRVPPACTLEMYKVLKAMGNDVKLLWYPNDGHAFAGKATALDLATNTFVWIQEKLNQLDKEL